MRSNEQAFIIFLAVAVVTLSRTTAASQHCYRPTYTNASGFSNHLPFNSMVVFGDSFSDVGNIQPGVWSWSGRYSDGRVWHEYVAQYFGLSPLTPSSQGGMDYAWGGATTDGSYIDAFSTALNATVPGVSQQINTYFDDLIDNNSPTKGNAAASPDSLHVLYSGYNDYWWYVYRNYTTSEGQDLNFTNVYTTVANEIFENVHRLYDAGARQFLVANVMKMSTWAEAGTRTQQVLDVYDVLVTGHNELLSKLLMEFDESHTDTTVYQFDVFASFECLNERKDYLGIQNVHDPCHPNESEDCGDIFGYKFWDWYHPTTHAHYVQSTSAIQNIYEKEEQKRKQQSSSSSTENYARTSLRKRRQK